MTMAENIFSLLILSLAVASITWTCTQEEIFREFREACGHRSQNAKKMWERRFFYVFTCEYCFSHWVTFFILLLTGFQLLINDWRGYVLAFFVLPWIANQWMSIYRRVRVEIKFEKALADHAIDAVKNQSTSPD